MKWIEIKESKLNDIERKVALMEAMKVIRKGIISNSGLITESQDKTLDMVEDKLNNEIQSPEDVKRFMDKNDKKIKSKIDDSRLKKAWNMLKRMVSLGKRGFEWIVDNWKVVLIVLSIVAVYCLGWGGIGKLIGKGLLWTIEKPVELLADGLATLTGPDYMAAGQAISDTATQCGGFGGWSGAGLGGGLR